MSTTNTKCEAPIHDFECLEIWGGNEAIHNAISVPGIDAWISSDPYDGDSQGGDIYYVSLCACARISRFLLADVSGHGGEVGDLARRLKSLMQKYLNTADQTNFARALNHEFSQLTEDGHFATAILATYFPPTDHLIICNAGHPRPIWYHAASQSWELLDQNIPQRATVVGNLPLGVIEPTEYTQFAVKLGKGDLVLIYTDSLIEAKNPRGKQLGEAGLLNLVRQLNVDQPQDVNRKVLAAIASYRFWDLVDDDQTLLVLHHNAANPPRQSVGQRLRVMAKMIGLIDHDGRHLHKYTEKSA